MHVFLFKITRYNDDKAYSIGVWRNEKAFEMCVSRSYVSIHFWMQ